ncbi:MAG TPA: HAMP domain-containing sensor histidine kinase [Acidobacteriaceae bacterium]|nr:HAMP domain-containing sensor histidine kinase [Acidobacteriaceae bacterium]
MQVVVRDTGHGIPAGALERVFEPFFTTRGQRGTGIGLWVSKQIIEKHGGQISIESRMGADASGTSVTLFLTYISSINGDCAAPAA